ncbi:MAG: MerR family transcriptional regulator [Candidatus Eisenbacteria bacterium]|nr:MerR family transcriptional regulator [Candidatus Eisenbacteria bacterium]
MSEFEEGAGEEPESRDKTYYSISEVAEMLDLKPHVLRYWETQFPTVRPRKGRSGSRMYTAREVERLRKVKTLLYERGFTIRGAQERLRLSRRSDPEAIQAVISTDNPWAQGLAEIRGELSEILARLSSARRPQR